MKKRKLFTVCMIFLIIMLLRCCTNKEAMKNQPPCFYKDIPENSKVNLTGTVARKEETDRGFRFYLKNNSIYYSDHSVKQSKVIVYSQKSKQIKTGDTLYLRGKITYFEIAENPGNFNMRKYYRMQGIQCAVISDKITILSHDKNSIGEKLFIFRKNLSKKVMELSGRKYGGFLAAILLGEKSYMDHDIKLLYQAAGIAHILAISGLHLSLVVMTFYFTIRKITGSYIIGGVAGFLFLFAYIGVTGLGISVVRAAVMFGIRVGADLCGRAYDVKNSYILAMTVVILWRKEAFLDTGFLLSFGAVFGIIFVYPVLFDEKKNGILLYKEIIYGISIEVATLPILLWNFFEFPFYAVILNILVLPFMPVVLGGTIVAVIVENISINAGIWCIKVPCFILKVYETFCTGTISLPGSRMIVGKPAVWGIVFYCLFVVLGLLILQIHKIGKIVIGFAVSILFISCPLFQNSGVEITVLSVGQGDGIFFQDQTIRCLLDGGSSTVKDVGKERIVPFLKSRGVSTLDYVFVSHGDADHYNGIREIINNQNLGIHIQCLVLPVREVWDDKLYDLAKTALKQGVLVKTIRPQDTIKGKQLELTCLYPSSECGQVLKKGNETSLIMELICGRFSILLTADVEKQGEVKMLENISHSYTVLKVGHHGSRNSTGNELLEKVKPLYAIISAGKKNSYGHPHKETIERLKNKKINILDTSENGAVIIKMKGKEVENFKIIHYN